MSAPTAMPDRLTLLIPGLLGPWDGPPGPLTEGLTVPALQRLLARADRQPGRAGFLDALLFDAFGHPDTAPELPVGAVTAVVDLDPAPGGWWMRADPVHLRADRDTLVLTGHGDLKLQDDETKRLAAELGEVFAPSGARLYAGPGERWYLALAEPPAVRTHPPAEVLGKGIRSYLPEGEQAPRWHALMNEAQMQLNLSAVNRAREAAGAETVNSLWFWGGGAVPTPARRWEVLWCDEPAGRGLAHLAGVPCHPVPPEGAPPLLTHETRAGRGLVVLDAAERALTAVDAARWRAAVQAINDRWLAPLLGAVKRGQVQQLTVISGNGTDYRLTRAGARRWWRRPRPLAGQLGTP